MEDARLQEMIKSGLSNSEWTLQFLSENVVITKDLLKLFGIVEDELTIIEKIQKLKIPMELVSHTDKRLHMYNDINGELKLKPNKKNWYIIKTKNFKRALFSLSSTRLTNEFRKHYVELEDIVRIFLAHEKNVDIDNLYKQELLNEAVYRFTKVIDERLINRIGMVENSPATHEI